MRTVFIGASPLTVMTAKLLLKRGHEVVVVERDKPYIDALSAEMDCGFVHGDGSKPAILRETDPGQTDVLLCLTGSDQANIIASLVGRSLGFARVVTKIEDSEFEHICIELGLEDMIVPDRTIGGHLADMVEGQSPLELSTMFRDDARAFSFIVRAGQADTVTDLHLGDAARVVCVYRRDKLIIPDDATKLKVDDEVVVITRHKHLTELEARWMT